MGCALHGHGHGHGGGGGGSHSHAGAIEKGEAHSHLDEAKSNHGHGHSHENMNVRAAMIHVISDFVQSCGVFVAAVVIYIEPSWNLIDPICTFFFSVLVLITTINIMKDAILVSILSRCVCIKDRKFQNCLSYTAYIFGIFH